MGLIAAFDRADDYDRHAPIQRQSAGLLADHIFGLPLVPRPRVLEIGCGTGFLGAALGDHLPGARWTMTDIAPNMVDRARARFAGQPGIDFRVMDGAVPDLAGPFDLICSNLAAQWFGDLPAAVARQRALLAPGGQLAFTTLAAGSFAEWRAAHGGAPSGVPDHPSPEALTALGLAVTIVELTRLHEDARDFLRSLKAIGAGTARAGHRPLAPAALRRVMARFEERGAIARYVIAICSGGAR